MGLNHYLALSAVLFAIGLYGALSKRSAVVVLMAVEVMLNAANIALVAFSRYVVPPLGALAANQGAFSGQIFAIFVITVAAAEAAVGLAIIIYIYRTKETVDVTEVDLMRG
ncbi:MAG: NADH-quinone oxidoreductase subunit NuoK [Chloroflexi bacterium]|nr:NADH-quinone oxidoreductase subunit NuoK [Chloroflexota bacterium]